MNYKKIAFVTLLFSVSAFGSTNKLLNCVSKSVESRKIDSKLVLEFMELLVEIKSDINRDQLLKKCELLKIRSEEKLEISRVGASKIIDAVIKSHQELKIYGEIVKQLSEKKVNCTTMGVDAGFSIGMGAGLGMNLGKCSSFSGKRFLMMAPEVSHNYGIGIYAMVDPGSFSFYEGEKFLKKSDESEAVIGLVLAITQGGAYNSEGYGIGLAYIAKDEYYLPLKLVPLKRNYKDLKEALE